MTSTSTVEIEQNVCTHVKNLFTCKATERRKEYFKYFLFALVMLFVFFSFFNLLFTLLGIILNKDNLLDHADNTGIYFGIAFILAFAAAYVRRLLDTGIKVRTVRIVALVTLAVFVLHVFCHVSFLAYVLWAFLIFAFLCPSNRFNNGLRKYPSLFQPEDPAYDPTALAQEQAALAKERTEKEAALAKERETEAATQEQTQSNFSQELAIKEKPVSENNQRATEKATAVPTATPTATKAKDSLDKAKAAKAQEENDESAATTSSSEEVATTPDFHEQTESTEDVSENSATFTEDKAK